MKNIFLNILLLFCFNLLGQDIHFSQFNDLPLNLNPALSGNMDGTVRAGTIYRNQWNSVTVPFESTGIFADFKANPKFLNGETIGWGVQILNDRSGNAGLSENIISFATSYHKFIDNKQTQLITGGISFGGFQKTIDISKVNFEDQFVFETANFGSFGSGEAIENNALTRFDLAMGASYSYFNPFGVSATGGISIAHLTKPNTSFFSNEDKLARRVNIHANCIYPVNERIDIDPSMLMSFQNKNNNIVLGTDILYDLGRTTVEKIDLKLGVFARLGDAINFTIGMNHDNWSIDLGYDINTSSLSAASQSRGAFEISISFVNRMYKGAKNFNYVIPGNRLL